MKRRGKILFILSFCCLGFFIGQNCLADSSVVINEIAWMGSLTNANAEWLELKNLSTAEVDLTGWTLNAADGQPKITLSGKIPANGYFLLERTNDETVPGITANQIYTGALGNNGEVLELKNAQGNLFDKIDNATGWSGGDNISKATMERAPDNFWCTSKNSGGTPKSNNDCVTQIPVEEDDQISTSTATSTTSALDDDKKSAPDANMAETNHAYISLEKLAITEIYPNPVGNDQAQEFIELYNSSERSLDLTGWKIEAKNGKSFVFGKYFNPTKTLRWSEYYVLPRSVSHIFLDNNGGELRLYKPDSDIPVQILQYGPAPVGASFVDTENISHNCSLDTKKFLANRLSLDRWAWSFILTPGKDNEIKSPNRPPIPNFYFCEDTAVGSPIFFDASDSVDEDNDPLTFLWDFGDGFNSTNEMPDHTFTKAGAYQVKLSVSDGLKNITLEKTVKVPSDFIEEIPVEKDSYTPVSPDKKVVAEKAPIFNSSAALQEILADNNGTPQENQAKGIENYKIGDAIKISGTVIVEPGLFGTQYFYILNPGEPALKVYNFKKDFPVIKRGDFLEVSGVLAKNSVEKYLKTSLASDIQVIGLGEMEEPEEVDKITEADFQKLVVASGAIAKDAKGQLVLKTSSSTISIFLKSATGISKSLLKEGSQFTIIGLISKNANALVLMPRDKNDIKVFTVDNDKIVQASQDSKDVSATASEWILPERKNNSKKAYLFLVIGGILFIIGYLIYIKYKKK